MSTRYQHYLMRLINLQSMLLSDSVFFGYFLQRSLACALTAYYFIGSGFSVSFCVFEDLPVSVREYTQLESC